MRTVSVNVYKFSELSDKAKDVARNWWREHALDYEWWESTFDDAENIGLKIDSFDLERHRHAKGKWTTGPGGKHPANGIAAANLILKEHGKDCETYKDAQKFLKDVEALGSDEADDYEEKLDTLDTEFLKTLLEDYSIMLQKEYEYLLSDESVDETITSNDYEFTEDGKRHNG